MEHVFLVYKTDSHHSYASRDLIGIATDASEAITICVNQAHKEGFPLGVATSARWDLQQLKQTQSYQGEGEFQYEQVQLNKLL